MKGFSGAARQPRSRPQLTIRRLEPADRDALDNLLRPQQIDDRLADQRRDEGIFLVAWEEATPLGYVFLRWHPGELVAGAVPGAALIEQLGVVPARRRQGIGSELLAAAERLAAGSGHRAAALAVGIDNADAERLYHERGYRPLDVPKRYLSWTAWDAEGRAVSEGEWVRYLAKRLTEIPRRLR